MAISKIESDPTLESVSKYILYAVVGIIVLIVITGAFFTIDAGHRGVLMTMGAVEKVSYGEGFHTKIPLIQNVVSMDVRTQKYEVTASAATKDLLDVTTQVTLNYHIVPEEAWKVYQEMGASYQEKVIAPAVLEVLKATTAKYTAEELITQRPAVKAQLDEALRERLLERGIVVEDNGVSLTDFQFPAAFNQAILDKQTAVQRTQEAQNLLEKMKIEAQQAQAVAAGQANAAIEAARGKANATLTEAIAETQKIEMINAQLQKSPQYIELVKAQAWDGQLPMIVGSGFGTFLNIGNLTQ